MSILKVIYLVPLFFSFFLLLVPQYPIIRKGHIRNTSEIWGNFKKRLCSQPVKFKKHIEKIKKRSLAKISWLRNIFSIQTRKKVKFKYC